ncbi:Coenzyme PQQ synthesis protein D [Paramagnetospirillum magnetotacticum MS-1]|uniref:Coenzyme PQQ synthesis protein D n=1 Tax=Paramagnetospirillum magnetotacticum MS-1 TaxID=272627 RepID=A0A0C2V329_PARME|nr:pyrroloquinoline quinone biosynthesis peptide chaperone PqqD [Paramagnetospirillum magnetotacticum]KIL99501.1 Coenzyme PQQ synthesis protein D [Paramagnetospirillum magnetotacticum MS-1]
MSDESKILMTDIIEVNPIYLLRWEESEQAHVLLYPEGIVKLNSSAGEILKRCVGGRQVGALITELSALCPEEDIAADILAFLEISNDKCWTRVKA